jgi:hypothetical protein
MADALTNSCPGRAAARSAAAQQVARMSEAKSGNGSIRLTPGFAALHPGYALCIGGVDLPRAPRAAVEDFLANREPPEEEAPRGRGRGSRREREHAWMKEREGVRPVQTGRNQHAAGWAKARNGPCPRV